MKSKHHVMKIPSIHMKKIYYEGNAKLCLKSNDNPSSLRESARTGSSLSPEHSKTKSILKENPYSQNEEGKSVQFSNKTEYLRIVSRKEREKEKEDKINRKCCCIIIII